MIDPIVRQVGFVTPEAQNAPREAGGDAGAQPPPAGEPQLATSPSSKISVPLLNPSLGSMSPLPPADIGGGAAAAQNPLPPLPKPASSVPISVPPAVHRAAAQKKAEDEFAEQQPRRGAAAAVASSSTEREEDSEASPTPSASNSVSDKGYNSVNTESILGGNSPGEDESSAPGAERAAALGGGFVPAKATQGKGPVAAGATPGGKQAAPAAAKAGGAEDAVRGPPGKGGPEPALQQRQAQQARGKGGGSGGGGAPQRAPAGNDQAGASRPTGPAKPPGAGAPAVPAEGEKVPLKQKTTKAERRMQQEAQRAAKTAAAGGGGATGPAAAAAAATEPGKGAGKKEREGAAAAAAQPAVVGPRKDAAGAVAGKKEAVPGVHDRRGPAAGQAAPAVPDAAKDKKKDMPAPRLQFDDEQRVAKAKRKQLVEQTETKNRVELFRHLPQYVHGTQIPSLHAKFFSAEAPHPHPAVYKVGLQYLTGEIAGGNARCVAMLRALQEMVGDYATPPERTLVRDLTAKINAHVSFLITCRPLSVGMGNAIKLLKQRIAKLPIDAPEGDAKAAVIREIDHYIQEKIVLADSEILKYAVQKIRAAGDVVLVYGASHVVLSLLIAAHAGGRRFRVVVLDSRPKLEGREVLRKLLRARIPCTYASLNAIAYVMQDVTRVFLGAAAVLANGTVCARVGTASVAMVAADFRVPVLICCESYKFHERVQLDSITSNELGNPEDLVTVEGRDDKTALRGWDRIDRLQLLNLSYDVMPAEYVTMIITEYGMVPPTSVPVILREFCKNPVLS